MKNKKDDKDKVKFKTRISNRLLNNKLARVLKKYYYYIEEKVKKSIRFELVIIFGLCFAVSALSYIFMNDLFRNEKTNAEIRYDYSRIERKAQQVVDDIEESKKAKGFNINDSKAFARVFDSTGTSDKIYITDIDGKVIHRNQNASEEKIDIFNTLKNVSRNMKSEVDGSEYTIIYPLDINNGKYYLIYNGIPPAEIEYVKYEVSNSFLALSLSIIMFIIIFLLATNKKTKYLDEIAKGIKIIAEGDLSRSEEHTF